MCKVKRGAEKTNGELGMAGAEGDIRPGGDHQEGEHALRPNLLQLEINLMPEIGQLL